MSGFIFRFADLYLFYQLVGIVLLFVFLQYGRRSSKVVDTYS
jgi:hypothetical protein